ncbi:MAG: hypothetical protein IPL22_18230 [Bacteroidetes bacterium]|nr:hypothetical protein [Bacteroidota bacterium]
MLKFNKFENNMFIFTSKSLSMIRASIFTEKIKSLFVCFFFFCVVFADAQPVLDWYKQNASGSSEKSHEIAVDKFNNVYLAGEISGMVDFDNGPGILQYNTNFSKSFFVCKYNSTGSLIWMKTLKLKANHRLFIDDSCNVLVVGNFTGIVDFDPDSSIFNLDAGPFGGSIYLLKLDSAGTFIWANNLNNLGNTIFYGFIKEDNQGNLYIGSEISNLSTIIKLDGGGNLLWTKSFGNTSCNVLEMDIDDSGNIIIGGKFSSIVDFDPDLGTAMLDASTGEIFLTKWNSTGQLIWAKISGETILLRTWQLIETTE